MPESMVIARIVTRGTVAHVVCSLQIAGFKSESRHDPVKVWHALRIIVLFKFIGK